MATKSGEKGSSKTQGSLHFNQMANLTVNGYLHVMN